MWGSYCGTVHWVVESQVGEYWRYVGEVGICVGDVLAYYGSAVWEKGWEASGSQGGEDRGAMCAKVKGEFTGKF